MGCTSLCPVKKTTRRSKTGITERGIKERGITETRITERGITEKELQKEELQEKEDQKQSLLDSDSKDTIVESSKTISEAKLGKFDDNFAWSAMVLAAQEKK